MKLSPKPLTDTDPMPWGKYRGLEMQEVPAGYFHWLWFSYGLRNDPADPVADYVRRNIPAFQMEHPDLIWT